MPVVLTTAPGVRRSGHVYDDRTGTSYEYPARRYAKYVQRGERFIYCEPRRGYFGAGVLGKVSHSPDPERAIVEIASWTPLGEYVPLTDSAGVHYELDPQYWTGSVYFAQGVRPISDATLERILGSVAPNVPTNPMVSPKAGGYASADVSRAVERISVDAVLAPLRVEFPDDDITEMPHNNPGFDIRVGPANKPSLFVEVKGTQSSEPIFFLSEGERQFSLANGDCYRFSVVTGIDLIAKSYEAINGVKALSGSVVSLDTYQWRGRLLP